MSIDWEAVKSRLRASQLALERALTPDPERIAAVHQQRAAQLAGRHNQVEARSDVRRVLTFILGTERYGVEFADVAELLPLGRCTPVPAAPPALCGVMNVHGEIRSVVDLGILLAIPGYVAGTEGCVLLLRKHDAEAMLRVDRLDRVQLVAAAELAVPDADEAGALPRYLQGLAADRLRLLSTDALLLHPLFQGTAAT